LPAVPNLAKVLQEEIRRITRRETRDELARLHQEHVALRRRVAALSKQVALLERAAGRAPAAQGVTPEADTALAGMPATPGRISGKAVRRLREKLGLTQAEFGRLVGVSGQSVYQWERHEGQLQLRSSTRQALTEVRALGTREVRARIKANSA
jgi:DNA-binding transcriptional regulator YiaG